MRTHITIKFMSSNTINTTNCTPPEWLGRLHELDDYLRDRGYAHSPDRWTNAHDLLITLRQQQRLPQTPKQIAHCLAPLFCRTPQEQNEFTNICQAWWNKVPVEKYSPQSIQQSAASSATQKTADDLAETQIKKRFNLPFWPWLLGFVLLLASLLGYIGYQSTTTGKCNPAIEDCSILEQPKPENPTITGNTAAPSQTVQTPLQGLNPRIPNQPPQLAPQRQQILDALNLGIPLIPVLALLLVLAFRYYRRKVVLQRRRDDPSAPLANIMLQSQDDTLFDGPGVHAALRRLHAPVYHRTRHLHAARTVEQSVRHAGLLHPVYREQGRVPDILVWVDLRHSADALAGLAQTLVKRLRQNDLMVHHYRSQGDPQRLYDIDQQSWHSLDELAMRHQGARLLVVGDSELFIDIWTGQPLDWCEQLQVWPQRWWLNAADGSTRRMQPLLESGLLLAQLNSAGLAQLTDSEQRTISTSIPPLPPMLADADRWQSGIAPRAETVTELMRVLQRYLGDDGMKLLSAVAVYPQLHWGLLRVLDISLNPQNKPEDSETRLLKFSRLPWLRGGWLPDWLRRELKYRMDAATRYKIAEVYRALLSEKANKGNEAISLPLRLPKKRSPWRLLRDLLATSPNNSSVRDHLFASLVYGGILDDLVFLLPRHLGERLLRPGRWLKILEKSMLLLVAAMLYWVSQTAWQQWGAADSKAWLLSQQRQVWSERTLNIAATPAMQTLATHFATWMRRDYGMQIQQTELPAQQAKQQVPFSQYPRAVINHHPARKELAEFIRQRLQHTGFGLPVELVAVSPEAETALDIKLDTITQTEPPAIAKPFRDSFNSVLIPDMVQLPGGTFDMGCVSGIACRDDELPVHPVTIQPFAIGRYEVTFAEYDQFAAATGREKPNDRGWGRGRRPVINVSWNDANAYAAWLSQQTGHRYRLPSEAEWEYATRVGTSTAYSFGNDQAKLCEYANGADQSTDFSWRNKDCNDGVGKQTASVGSYKSNLWDLYDMHGNVWEWTQDCWHGNYVDAPTDGTAWEEANKGECSRRVARGGGWDNKPENLRSANRGRLTAGDTIDLLGFRLARTL